MQKLSRRMETVAGLCKAGRCVADVGCDHGYVSIWLMQNGRFEKAVAMDVRKGPLSAAREHIAAAGLSDRIECRLSDGCEALTEGEADALILAGMGGALTISILKAGADKVGKMRQLVLQPQSEIAEVRRYLALAGFFIEAEEMLEEDGKYYSAFRAVPGAGDEDRDELFFYYGKALLEARHPVLKRFLEREQRLDRELLSRLSTAEGERAEERYREVEKDLSRVEKALVYYSS